MKYQVTYRYSYTHKGITYTGFDFYGSNKKAITFKEVKRHLDSTCSQESPTVQAYRVDIAIPAIPYPNKE